MNPPLTEREMRSRDVPLFAGSMAHDPIGAIRSVLVAVSKIASLIHPEFAVPDSISLEFDEGRYEIMGYHDYSIHHRTARILLDGVERYEVAWSVSGGYDRSEDRIRVNTLGFGPGYIVGIVEYETGSSLLLWKGYDISVLLGGEEDLG